MGRRKCAGMRELIEQTRGGALALVALFLPIAVLCVGMVVDLGTVFFVRKAVQAACAIWGHWRGYRNWTGTNWLWV